MAAAIRPVVSVRMLVNQAGDLWLVDNRILIQATWLDSVFLQKKQKIGITPEGANSQTTEKGKCLACTIGPNLGKFHVLGVLKAWFGCFYILFCIFQLFTK